MIKVSYSSSRHVWEEEEHESWGPEDGNRAM